MGGPTVTELTDAFEILNKIVDHTNTYNKDRIESFGLTEDFCDFITTLSDEDIETITLPQIKSYLSQYGIDSGNILVTFAKGDNSVPTLEKWKEFLSELRTTTKDLNESVSVRDELKEAIDNIYKEQAKFLQSDEYKSAYLEKVEKLKALAEGEEDPITRKKYIAKLDALKKASTLSFLLDRLDNPKYNKDGPNGELDRLMTIFFSTKRSQYLLERYEKNIAKLKIPTQFHTNLYNIEEEFLSEQFYPLNNFFLFIVINYIAYIDPTDDIDKLCTTTVLSMMGNLKQKMLNDTEKNLLIGLIRNIENRMVANDKIMDKFRSDNTTWKEHPIRQEIDEKRKEMEHRNTLIDEIREALGFGFGAKLTDGNTITFANANSILRTMSTKQIEGIHDEVLAEKATRQKEKAEAEKATSDEVAYEEISESAEPEESLTEADCCGDDESEEPEPVQEEIPDEEHHIEEEVKYDEPLKKYEIPIEYTAPINDYEDDCCGEIDVEVKEEPKKEKPKKSSSNKSKKK